MTESETASPPTTGHLARTAGVMWPWAMFLSLSALVLRPALTTTIVADDFLIPFYQYDLGGSSFVEALRIGWRGAASGHFNYLGQIIGAIVGWLWIQLVFRFGINFSIVFAVTKYVVFILTALAGARFVRRAAEAVGTDLSVWRARAYVAIALFGTLQIHIPWSNDPTGSFPMSGFASAAVGLLILSEAIPAFLTPSWKRSFTLAGISLAGVLYYEVNAAVVAAMLPLALWAAFGFLAERRTADRRTTERKTEEASSERGWSFERAAMAGVPLLLPAVMTVVIRLLTSPAVAAEQYSGTSISAGGDMLGTLRNAILSSLPGSAWKLSRDWLATPFEIRIAPVVVTVVTATALALLMRRAPASGTGRPTSYLLAAALAVTPVAYWLGATAIQAVTPKVQAESHGIGYVYNYYAVGVSALAVTIALVVAVFGPRLWPTAKTLLGVVAVSFVILQFFVSWNITHRFSEVTLPNQQVLTAYARDLPESERCSALDAWLGGAWPDYYRAGLVDGIQGAHEEYRGEPFCERLVDDYPGKPES